MQKLAHPTDPRVERVVHVCIDACIWESARVHSLTDFSGSKSLN